MNQTSEKIFWISKIESILKSKLFWTGIIIKLILGSLSGSQYLTQLFLPFISNFVENPSSNPYQFFSDNGNNNFFPYPSFMLYLVSFPALILNIFTSFQSLPIEAQLLSVRFTLLIFDIAILLILYRWLYGNFKKLIYLYWFSPILIYISFIHGQLDVIPIALLFISLHFLFKEKNTSSAFFLGLSLATKTNISLTIPFILIYFYRREKSVKSSVQYLFTALFSFLIVNLPYLASSGFQKMVFMNSEQGKVFSLFWKFPENRSFYLLPAALILLFFQSLKMRNYNRDLLVMLLGLYFGVLLFFVTPVQGWYYWALPFFIYFSIKGNKPSFYWGLAAMQLFYLVYFGLIPSSDYMTVFNPILQSSNAINVVQTNLIPNQLFFSDLAFTLLQTSLLVACATIYKRGLKNFSKFKIHSQPFLMAIAGDSGAGKSTLTNQLLEIFGENNVTVVHGDDTHKWERGHEKWNEITHLNPKANELHKEYAELQKLKSGQSIFRKKYDHSTGKFVGPLRLDSNKLILVEGLHPFFIRDVRSLFDLKVFLKPQRELVYKWKINRDVNERKHSPERVIEQIKKRESDYGKFVEAQELVADVTLETVLSSANQIENSKIEAPDLSLRFYIKNEFDIEPLILSLESFFNIKCNHEYVLEDRQLLEIPPLERELDFSKIQEFRLIHFSALEELSIPNIQWQSNQSGLIQIVLTYLILNRAKNEH